MDDGEWRNPASLWKPRRSKCHQGSKEEWRGAALKEASFQQPSVDLETCFSGPQCASHELQWPSGPGQQTSSFPTSEVESSSAGATRRVLVPIPSLDWSNDAGPSQSRPPTSTLSFLFLCVLHLDFPVHTAESLDCPHAPGLGCDAMGDECHRRTAVAQRPSESYEGQVSKRLITGTVRRALPMCARDIKFL